MTATDPDATSYFYHVTFYNRLPGIAARGLISGAAPAIGGKYFEGHKTGNIFLTTFGGLFFWQERAEQWGSYYSDDLLEEGFFPVVLRVLDTDELIEECEEDTIGSEDSGEYALKCNLDSIAPDELEVFWDGEWMPVEDFERIDPSEAFDEEGYLIDDGPHFFAY